MAQSVLDSGWGMLKRFLAYKCEHAARGFEVTSERNTSVTCSACGARSGPRGVNGLIVRSWVCRDCGESHDRDVNAARNILIGSRYRTSVARERVVVLADSVEQRLSRSRGRHRISEDGGMRTG